MLDGWWIEGHYRRRNRLVDRQRHRGSADSAAEIDSLYDKLENIILPMFYHQPERYAEIRRSTIAINGSFFNTQRMLLQYLSNAYFPADAAAAPGATPRRRRRICVTQAVKTAS